MVITQDIYVFLTLNLPKKVEQKLEKDLKYLEETTDQSTVENIKNNNRQSFNQ